MNDEGVGLEVEGVRMGVEGVGFDVLLAGLLLSLLDVEGLGGLSCGDEILSGCGASVSTVLGGRIAWLLPIISWKKSGLPILPLPVFP